MDKCKITGCEAKIKSRCRCMRSDTTCEAGHNYHHFNRDGKTEIHPGHSGHGHGICCPLALNDR